MQTALPAILALTYPGSKIHLDPQSGIQGTFAEVNRWSVLVPLGIMFVAGLANWFIVGPKTIHIMKLRKHQGEQACLGELLARG